MLETRVLLPVSNRSGDIDVVKSEFSKFAETAAVPDAVANTMQIVLDELVSNVWKYGYDDDGDHTIEIAFRVADEGVEIEIVDDGHPFNILELPPPDVSLALTDRPIGGLGIHMVKKMTDEQHYERRDGRNRSTIRKRFSRPAER